jgi:hypothetical protein
VSQFLTPPVLRVLRGQFRKGRQLFSLEYELQYESDLLGGTLVIPKGYVTDLASVPRLPLTWLLAGGTGAEPSLPHDFLYFTREFDGKPITRSKADSVFLEALRVSEDIYAPAWLMYLAVRVGGGGAWRDEGPIQTPHVAAAITASAQEAP